MSEHFAIPKTKNEKWLNFSTSDLIKTRENSTLAPRDEKFLDKFLDLSLPVLKKFKSGFVAEMGDIQVCLLIHLEDNGLIKVEVCSITDEGELKSRIEEKEGKAVQLVKSFITDFPTAVMTTSNRKPLCLFMKKETDTMQTSGFKSGSNEGSLGFFAGYMNWETFKGIISKDTNKITVAVP